VKDEVYVLVDPGGLEDELEGSNSSTSGGDQRISGQGTSTVSALLLLNRGRSLGLLSRGSGRSLSSRIDNVKDGRVRDGFGTEL
jgi:hypothetical protein